MPSRAVPWICAALHLLALVVMALWLRPGTEWQTDPALRANHIAAHFDAWAAGWLVWMAAAVSLVAFYAWWAARLPRDRWTIAAVLLGGAGMACDLMGETLYIAAADSAHDVAVLLTAGAANALYTVAGVVLTLRTPDFPRGIRLAMWTTWTAGAVMTVSALFGWTTGIAIATAVLFPLFIGWTIWMARSWRTP